MKSNRSGKTSTHRGVLFVGFFGVLLSSGCATSIDYAEINNETKTRYGYKSKKLEDGRHNILIKLPEVGGSKAVAHSFWDQRAIDLCGSQNYEKNIYRAQRPTVRYESYGGRPGDFYLEGYLTCLDTSTNNEEDLEAIVP